MHLQGLVSLDSFFHERGRHVGGVPRSSLKEKESPDDNGEGNTSKTPKQTKTPTQQQTNNKKDGQRPSPHYLGVFPLYGSETGETNWLRTIYGPEFAKRNYQERSAHEQSVTKPNKGASFHPKSCCRKATVSSGKT